MPRDLPRAAAAKAACLWIDAEAAISRAPGHAGDTVAAGTFSWPSTGYLEPYLGLLASQGHMPTTYSIHDYGDPAGSGLLGRTRTDELTAFDAALARNTAAARAPATQLWVTESGVNLTDRDLGYAEARSLPCTGAPGSTLPFTLGACLDGNANASGGRRAGVLRPAFGHGRPAGDRGVLVSVRRCARRMGLGSAGLAGSGPVGVLRVDAAAGHGVPGRPASYPVSA